MRRSLYRYPDYPPEPKPPFNAARFVFFLLLACLLGSVLSSRR